MFVWGRGELVWYWGRGTGRWGVWDRMCVDMEWGVEGAVPEVREGD